MNASCICTSAEENGEPASECELPTMTSSGCRHWRETTLLQLEAWIEEREKLIARIEMRIREEMFSAGEEGDRWTGAEIIPFKASTVSPRRSNHSSGESEIA